MLHQMFVFLRIKLIHNARYIKNLLRRIIDQNAANKNTLEPLSFADRYKTIEGIQHVMFFVLSNITGY